MNVTLTIERNDEGKPWCIRARLPGKYRMRKTLATIYRDGIDTFVVFARGREEYLCDSVHVAIGYAGGCAGVMPVPEEWHTIAEQFERETQSDAEETTALNNEFYANMAD